MVIIIIVVVGAIADLGFAILVGKCIKQGLTDKCVAQKGDNNP